MQVVLQVTLDHLQLMDGTALRSLLLGSDQTLQDILLGDSPEAASAIDGEHLLRKWVLVDRARYAPGGGLLNKILSGLF